MSQYNFTKTDVNTEQLVIKIKLHQEKSTNEINKIVKDKIKEEKDK